MTEPVRLIRADELTAGHSTRGMRRETAVATDGMWAGVAHTDAGAFSAWHHHGEHESMIYVLNGALRMESGAGGRDVLDARPGDFLYVPPFAIHREGNPTDATATIVVARAGHGVAVVDVVGPEPG